MGLFKRAYGFLFRLARRSHYRILSTNGYTGVRPVMQQPVLFKGKGSVRFEGECILGWITSPAFHNTHCYIEAREESSRIIFGAGSLFNNNFQVIANTGSIRLGRNLTVGINCSVMNSDFHNLDYRIRGIPPYPTEDIVIGDNVFLGNNVTVLKGVEIGENSTIGSGSVVTSSIPANCVASGIPAKVLKQIAYDRL